jgi:hypothetical protein
VFLSPSESALSSASGEDDEVVGEEGYLEFPSRDPSSVLRIQHGKEVENERQSVGF